MVASTGTDQVMALAATYAAATRAGDIDALRACCEPDAVVWHNYNAVEVSMEQANKTLAWLHRKVTDLDWRDVAVLPTPSGFVWQAVMTGKAAGGALEAHTCMVATVSLAGRVTRLEEYLDLGATSVLHG
ncbi:nuclear transport factor 2 family protein [Acidiferrimicrobium sp. IK]|uniref:nuclear transport factor 2 family protein n=1 Tax=Acidiferrimicrobium sp. IK TaxID=2871700 RepID=UPI0021CB14B1|nr:nuclear transport factor 2 family protein [Acidiferrimicrobium sp. IK]MCU4185301.1 nuclear transport factor 2 family protein [Acidiferrimicrobium sp. IK]